MTPDPQLVEEAARSHWLAGMIGAVIALRSTPNTTWPERAFSVVCGAAASYIASPALCEYFGMTTQAMQSAMGFAVGLFGLNVIASLLAWTKVLKVEDYIPWKKKGNEE